jgi:hypothetical protein
MVRYARSAPSPSTIAAEIVRRNGPSSSAAGSDNRHRAFTCSFDFTTTAPTPNGPRQ